MIFLKKTIFESKITVGGVLVAQHESHRQISEINVYVCTLLGPQRKNVNKDSEMHLNYAIIRLKKIISIHKYNKKHFFHISF